jgi:hypothetical protein
MRVSDREMPSIAIGGMSRVVEESTLGSAEPGSLREEPGEAVLRRCMREHVLPDKLSAGRRLPGLLVSRVHCSLGLSL